MIWASRTYASDEWFDALDQFEHEFDAAGMPLDRLLCRTEALVRTTIYVSMPDAALLDAYEGFERCPEPGGSVQPLLLMGDEAVFEMMLSQRGAVRDTVD